MQVNRRYRFASDRGVEAVEASSWRDRAVCRPGQDGAVSVELAELFFPDGRWDTERVKRQVEAAKAVCAGCPVLAECHSFAVANPSLTAFGVWGGLSEQDRLVLARRERRARRLAAGVAA